MAAIAGQVLLIALVMRFTYLESYAFHRMVYIAIVGFVIHHALPLRFRLPFFALLSLTALVLVLGETPTARIIDTSLGLTRAGAILAVGAVLITICHLPARFWFRVGLLITAGLAAAVFRAGLAGSAVPAIAWLVLAAMFMFRIVVYHYDVTNSSHRPSISQSIAYFFLLPNICTLLFPVIDFNTFCQKYYDEEAFVIYQRGAKWMARGVIQLLLYRLISRLLAIEASDVADGTDLIQFVITNMFLYLKVSGSFHLVIGLLLLFGFNLPETNHRYFLASSFTDYWRRVNIYWRVFIMKVFYYPTYYRLKNLGQTKAMVLATALCFFMTWALHLYQTWWLTGTVSWTMADALFWTALALLVLFNSLWELKRKRRRKLSTGYSVREAAGLAGRTAGTFAVISILWSLWSTPTITQWLHIWSFADWHTLTWGGLVLAVIMIATILFEVWPTVRSRPAEASSNGSGYVRSPGFRRDIMQCVVPLALIGLLTHPTVQERLDSAKNRRLTDAGALDHVLRDGEAMQRGRGYYENLTDLDRGTGQFWETMNPNFAPSFFNSALLPLDRAPLFELTPNIRLEKNGLTMATNRWGMRDRDHALPKATGTLRVAMLGSSQVMGYELPMEEMFVPSVEARLNRDQRLGGRIEMLNFSVSGKSPFGQIDLLQKRVAKFSPDIVLLVTHFIDAHWITRDVVACLNRRIPLVAGFPSRILKDAGVDGRTNEVFGTMRLRPFEPEMLSVCYRQMVAECRSIHALPVCIFLPVPDDLPLDKTKAADLLGRARDAGFIVIDLSDIYAGLDPKDLMLPERWHHSNAKANAIIAAALYSRLTNDPQIDLLNRVRNISGAGPMGAAITDSFLRSNTP